MHVVFDPDAATFLDHAGAMLEADEAANGMILGLCSSSRPASALDGQVYARVEDGARTVAAVVLVPGRQLLLTATPPGALEPLVAGLEAAGARFTGLAGPALEAQRLADLWAARTAARASLAHDQRIYRLPRVVFPPPIAGRFRPADAPDRSLLGRWAYAFHAEATPHELPTPDEMMENAARRIDAGQLFVWERDGHPVAMAGLAGPTRHGIRVNAVYTPLELRGQGLASAVVAHLSQHALDTGRRFVFLYTDLANPTTNRIYQRMGYEPVCDARLYSIEGS
jgi:GNAT superfamily N-acetyltransferase